MVARCVMQSTCLWRDSAARRSPTASATSPPMPASTSSKMSVLTWSDSARTPLMASMTRESSPPEAMARSLLNGSPRLGEMTNSMASLPHGREDRRPIRPRRIRDEHAEAHLGHAQLAQLLLDLLLQTLAARRRALFRELARQLRDSPFPCGRSPIRASSSPLPSSPSRRAPAPRRRSTRGPPRWYPRISSPARGWRRAGSARRRACPGLKSAFDLY